MIIGETLEKNRRFFPDLTAITDGNRHFTYQEFSERIFRLMNGLQAFGLSKGDRVACLMTNISEFMELYFAVPACGMVIVPINFRLGPAEIEYILDNSGATALFVQHSLTPGIEAIRDRVPSVKHFVCIGSESTPGYSEYEKILAEQPGEKPQVPAIDENDLADISYTSGTTGRPKGVMLTHKNIMTQNYNIMGHSYLNEGLEDDVWMCLYPYFHVGVMPVFAGLTFGVTNVLANFDPAQFYRLVEDQRVTYCCLPPVMLEMLKNSGINPGAFDLSNVRMLGVAGQPSLLTTVKWAFETFSHPDLMYITSLGITETFSFNTLSHITRGNISEVESLISTLPVKTAAVPSGFNGVYPHVDMKIVDENRQEIGPGVVGEFAFKGNNVMKGYWHNDEATAEVLKDGWYYSGDMGLFHPDKPHCSFMVDRIKDLIVSGSENVYPAEVELTLMQHPAVEAVSVFGVPDTKWGEAVNAAVIRMQGQEVTESDLRNFCKERIASYKKPTRIWFVEEFPSNAFGKILKKNLRQMVIDETQR